MPNGVPEEHHDDNERDTSSDLAADVTSGAADSPVDGQGAAGPCGEWAEVITPRPRSPLDDSPVLDLPPLAKADGRVDDREPETGFLGPDFRYDQAWLRGKRRRYHGHVEWISGTEGERLREDLVAAVRDLLNWAARHINQDGTDRTHTPDGTEPGADADEGGTSR